MKVADLSTDELKELIGKVIEEKFRELLAPDYGLELREDFVQALKLQLLPKKEFRLMKLKSVLD